MGVTIFKVGLCSFPLPSLHLIHQDRVGALADRPLHMAADHVLLRIGPSIVQIQYIPAKGHGQPMGT